MRQELRLNRRSTLRATCGVAVIALTVAYISSNVLLLEMRLYDERVRAFVQGTRPSDVVIVGIDDESIDELAGWGPTLARSNYAEMVRRLREAGASVIGIDVVMTKPSEDDAELAEELRMAGNVVLVAGADAEVDEERKREKYTFREPVAELVGAARMVASPLVSRPQNVVRWLQTWQVDGEEERMFPALSMAVAQVHNAELAKRTPSVEGVRESPEDEVRWIRWIGRSPAFDVVSARDLVLSDNDDAFRAWLGEAVGGKVVLIGRWDQMDDTLPTCLGRMHGVEIHAHAAATVLGGYRLRHSRIGNALLAICLALVVAWFGSRWRARRTILLTLGLILLLVIVAFVAFSASGAWIEVVPAALVLTVVGVFVVVVQGERSASVLGKVLPHWVFTQPKEFVGTVLVCDIRGYTTRSEAEPTEEVMNVLADFFAAIDRAVTPHHGVTARRPGDAAIILFHDEEDLPSHADRAVRAAVDLRAVLAGLRVEFEAKGRKPLETGTTVVTGELSVGILGTAQIEQQIIGDPLNTAFRLQDVSRDRGHDVLIAGETVDALALDHPLVEVGIVRVRGREADTVLFTIGPGA